jgi:3D (Asp-Asp-Asp) domain-containing protein
MQSLAIRVLPLALLVLAAGCSSTRSLPRYEKPLARAQFQTVRTTAYTHTEGDHLQYSNRNACGDVLQAGTLRSAACDWSRWPVGTVFRIQETGETYIVDDYGWALAGTNTIDLYKPSRSAMNAWGVRRIHLEILQWGDVNRSLAILRPRTKYAHVRRMVEQIRSRYAELAKPMPLAPPATVVAEVTASPAPEADAASAPRALAVAGSPSRSNTTPGGFVPAPSTRPQLTPFATNSGR